MGYSGSTVNTTLPRDADADMELKRRIPDFTRIGDYGKEKH
jgi:hypothetical protein